jgi:hypothetical protein
MRALSSAYRFKRYPPFEQRVRTGETLEQQRAALSACDLF